MQTITIEQKASRERAPVRARVTVRFGLDVHAGQITVCRSIDGQVPQPAQKFGWSECIEWFGAHVQAGALVHSCYEAGPLHRRLLTEVKVAESTTQSCVFPLCLVEDNEGLKLSGRCALNFAPAFLKKVAETSAVSQEGSHDFPAGLAPEDIIDALQ